MLAAKLVLESGVEVEVITFETRFCHCSERAEQAAKAVGVPLKVVHTGADYLRMVRNPKHGYGKNVNPCVDCHLFMIKKAKKYAKQVGAKFVFTGEVLGQRPMSQHRQQLDIVADKAGLKGKLVRPLSAKLLPKTEAELKGYIKEVSLRGIYGRSRKPQIELAKQFGFADYAAPAGGCLLTEQEYAKKLRDLFRNKTRITARDVEILHVGRHFRLGENKIVVGRNQSENAILMQLKARGDLAFEVPDCGSPTTLLQGPKTKRAVVKAAELTAFHSDKRTGQVEVTFGKEALNRKIKVTVPARPEVDKLRI